MNMRYIKIVVYILESPDEEGQKNRTGSGF